MKGAVFGDDIGWGEEGRGRVRRSEEVRVSWGTSYQGDPGRMMQAGDYIRIRSRYGADDLSIWRWLSILSIHRILSGERDRGIVTT